MSPSSDASRPPAPTRKGTGAAAPLAGREAPRGRDGLEPLQPGAVEDALSQPHRPEHLELYHRDADREHELAEITDRLERHADGAELAPLEELAARLHGAGQ